MTGIERLRAQVEGGSSTNVVIPRAMLRDILHDIERDMEAAGRRPRAHPVSVPGEPPLCSACDGRLDWRDRYCPHCGAEVRGA